MYTPSDSGKIRSLTSRPRNTQIINMKILMNERLLSNHLRNYDYKIWRCLLTKLLRMVGKFCSLGGRIHTSSSIVSTPLLNRAYHLHICARDKQLSPYTCLIISTVSAAVLPSLKQNSMFVLCSMALLWPRPLTTCKTWRRISRHAQRGALRCCQITDEVWAHGWHALHHRWHFYLGQNKISRII